MGDDESAKRPVGQLVLAGAGGLLLVAGLLGYFAGQDDEIAGSFFVLVGLVLVVLAAFYSRVDGIVELGLLRIPDAKARRAEKQFDRGLLIAGDGLEEALTALQEALARYRDAHLDADGNPVARPRHEVLLVEDAVFTMATLTLDEQALVRTEVARMSRPEFHPTLDPGETRPGDTGRTYRMHRVPDSDIRLWYRQKSDSEPYPLYVTVVEDTGKDRRT